MTPNEEDKYAVLDWVAFFTESTVMLAPAIIGLGIGYFFGKSYGFNDGLFEKPLSAISLGDIFRFLWPIVCMYGGGWIGWQLGKAWVLPVEKFFERVRARPENK
jgi:hypothetical protein